MSKRALLSLGLACILVYACGSSGTTEDTPSIDNPQDSVGTDNDSGAGDSDDDSLTVSELDSEPLIDSSGSLRDVVSYVNSTFPSYDRHPSLENLVETADVIAVAQAGERYEHDDDPIMTRQDFATIDVWMGEAEADLSVVSLGGVAPDPEGRLFLQEPDQEPQFRSDGRYLLFLRESSMSDEYYLVVGPAAGRYLVEDETITATYLADVQAEDVDDLDAADAPTFESLVGQTLSDVEGEVADLMDR